MHFIEPLREQKYVVSKKNGSVVRQDTELTLGPLVPFVAGGVLFGAGLLVAPVVLSVILLILGGILIATGPALACATGFRGLLAFRDTVTVPGLEYRYSQIPGVVDHPQFQEAIKDFENSGSPFNAHWRNEFEFLYNSVVENKHLLARKEEETLPSGYHLAVEAHNEMLQPPRAIVAERKSETKNVDPKSVGVSLHLKYKELEIIRNALRRDPYYNSEGHKDLNKRLLKAQAEVNASASFETPVNGVKCQHKRLKELLKPGDIATCYYCDATFEYTRTSIENCSHERVEYHESLDADGFSDFIPKCPDCGKEGWDDLGTEVWDDLGTEGWDD